MIVRDEMRTDNNFMLDIESLGQSPGGVVTSVAITRFVPVTGEITDEFKVNIDIQSSLNLGLTVDGSTLGFWFNPEQRGALSAMLDDAKPVSEAISLIRRFANTYDTKREAFWWANGANFDFGLLEQVFRAEKNGKSVHLPWKYRHLLDMRTIRQIMAYEGPPEWFDGTMFNSHDALEDCRRQVLMVKEMLNA